MQYSAVQCTTVVQYMNMPHFAHFLNAPKYNCTKDMILWGFVAILSNSQRQSASRLWTMQVVVDVVEYYLFIPYLKNMRSPIIPCSTGYHIYSTHLEPNQLEQSA